MIVSLREVLTGIQLTVIPFQVYCYWLAPIICLNCGPPVLRDERLKFPSLNRLQTQTLVAGGKMTFKSPTDLVNAVIINLFLISGKLFHDYLFNLMG